MRGMGRAGIRTAAAALAAAAVLFVAAAAANATTGPIYDNIPSPLPGNVPSFGFEADGLTEFGQRVAFAQHSGEHNGVVTVVMSSWSCQEGNWQDGSCKTKKHGYKWPITLDVGGTLITRAFKVPYRPSASAVCATPEFEAPGAWYDATDNRCYHGLAFPITFHLPKHPLLPDAGVVVEIRFDTTHHGPAPVGEGAACYSTPQGCPYDSLNVGVILPEEGLPTIGSSGEALLIDSTWAAMYCGDESEVGKAEFVFCPSFYEGARLATEVTATGRG
jgi:hypothetical protein